MNKTIYSYTLAASIIFTFQQSKTFLLKKSSDIAHFYARRRPLGLLEKDILSFCPENKLETRFNSQKNVYSFFHHGSEFALEFVGPWEKKDEKKIQVKASFKVKPLDKEILFTRKNSRNKEVPNRFGNELIETLKPIFGPNTSFTFRNENGQWFLDTHTCIYRGSEDAIINVLIQAKVQSDLEQLNILKKINS